jgi:hypothetical protein
MLALIIIASIRAARFPSVRRSGHETTFDDIETHERISGDDVVARSRRNSPPSLTGQ